MDFYTSVALSIGCGKVWCIIDVLRMLKFTLLSVTETLGIVAAEGLLPHFLAQVVDECCLSLSASESADVRFLARK